MAVVKPFRALRYDVSKAGPFERLVAPPYDVIGDEERGELRARSPYNVVNLTLPDDEEQAARDLAAWRGQGVLVEEEPTAWVLAQDYVGPDGVARTRVGVVASLRVEPYESRVVLPHERTHRGPKEGRLRLLRATRTQLEPIFLLHDGPRVEALEGTPEIEVEGTRLWRADERVLDGFGDSQLLIADGHHRYETALAYHAEEGTEASTQMLVVLVSTHDPGLTIFPTHRVFERRPEPFAFDASQNGHDPERALAELEGLPYDRPAFALYEGDGARVVRGNEPQLDVQLVDRLGTEGIGYTPDWHEAVRRVDDGEAALACLLRPTRIEDVFRVARRGDVLPPKTTYFYPKLLSGLLFHPVD